MTPEDRAREAYRSLYGAVQEGHLLDVWTESIRAAMEACAEVAISYAQAYMSEETYGDGRQCGEQIAAAIRARTR